jgi:hypothetical protein
MVAYPSLRFELVALGTDYLELGDGPVAIPGRDVDAGIARDGECAEATRGHETGDLFCSEHTLAISPIAAVPKRLFDEVAGTVDE